jgi:hypothetical protein
MVIGVRGVLRELDAVLVASRNRYQYIHTHTHIHESAHACKHARAHRQVSCANPGQWALWLLSLSLSPSLPPSLSLSFFGVCVCVLLATGRRLHAPHTCMRMPI